jgi:protein TonB
MHKNFLTHDEHSALNDIIFEKRNKAYGAYELRNESNAVLQKALFVGISLFAAFTLVPILMTVFKEKPKTVTESGPFILRNLPQDVDKTERVRPIVLPPKANVQIKTQSLTPPTPTRNATNEQTINQKVDDAVIAVTTSPGESVANPNQHITTGPAENTKPGVDVAPKPNPDVIVDHVDIEADFSGGINAFRNKVVENFNTSAVDSESGEVIKGIVTFIVETDGSISNIKVSGANIDFNKEAERTIKKINGKWNPAKLQGDKVRSYFRLPISMQFE